ncbi:MAG: hypothetical protein ABIO72_00615 [Patescibacteria group bacterium]
MTSVVRIQEKPYFVWDSFLFQGGCEYAISAERDKAERILRLIEEDDTPAEDDVAEVARTQDGETRFCYALRLPRPLTSFVQRHPISTLNELAHAMFGEDDVRVRFGTLNTVAYPMLLGHLVLHEEPKGESCFILKTSTGQIALAANRPLLLIRISSLP